VTVSVLQSTVFSPKGIVESYVQDIADGRFAAAFAAGPGASTGNTALVKSDDVALASAISDVEIGDPESQGDDRVLPISYELNGERETGYISVRSAGKQFLFFDTWKISEGLETDAYVSVYGADEVTVGGAAVPLDRGAVTLIAYPGIFDVTAGESKWFTLEESSLRVTSFGGSISSMVVPTSDLTDEVQSQVNAAIDECVTSTEEQPEGCPFSLYAWYDTRNIVWSVVTYPTIAVRSATSFSYDKAGEVKATFESQSFSGDWEADEDEVTVYVYGEIEVSGDDVSITFD
jgi:hypothetical protein